MWINSVKRCRRSYMLILEKNDSERMLDFFSPHPELRFQLCLKSSSNLGAFFNLFQWFWNSLLTAFVRQSSLLCSLSSIIAVTAVAMQCNYCYYHYCCSLWFCCHYLSSRLLLLFLLLHGITSNAVAVWLFSCCCCVVFIIFTWALFIRNTIVIWIVMT